MTSPTLSRHLQTFAGRADALGHFFQRAGDAPRLVAFDDAVGCPLHHALSALEWTLAIGILQDADLVHAAKAGGERSAAVVERREGSRSTYLYFGPQMDAASADPFEASLLYDEPGVRAYEFRLRAQAIAHFLRTTHGSGSVIALLAQRAPELRHVRRWLAVVCREPAANVSNLMLAGWFATAAGGVLFAPATPGDPWVYDEVETET